MTYLENVVFDRRIRRELVLEGVAVEAHPVD
jgi:hypothetical protein